MYTFKDFGRLVNKNPLFYGVPFVLLMVGSSYGMTAFTKTRYELHDQTVQAVSKEQKLGLDRDRKPFNIQETYFKITSKQSEPEEHWDPSAKRITRPKGLAEWGEAPTSRPDVPEERVDRKK